jgi:hypothetical protein
MDLENRQDYAALVDDDTFQQVQLRIAAGARRPDIDRNPRASKRGYALSGMWGGLLRQESPVE